MRMQTFVALAAVAWVWPVQAERQTADDESRAVSAGQVPTAAATEPLAVPGTRQWLGTIRLPVAVLPDGKSLPAGAYRVRLTGEHADTKAAGQLAELERWVEFVQGSTVKRRAVVPAAAVRRVAESRPPTRGRFRVDRLKGNDYLRARYNYRGDQVLIYLPIEGASRRQS